MRDGRADRWSVPAEYTSPGILVALQPSATHRKMMAPATSRVEEEEGRRAELGRIGSAALSLPNIALAVGVHDTVAASVALGCGYETPI